MNLTQEILATEKKLSEYKIALAEVISQSVIKEVTERTPKQFSEWVNDNVVSLLAEKVVIDGEFANNVILGLNDDTKIVICVSASDLFFESTNTTSQFGDSISIEELNDEFELGLDYEDVNEVEVILFQAYLDFAREDAVILTDL